MQTSQALDVMEALFNAARHPDIVAVQRYGSDTTPGGQSPAGIKTVHPTGSYGMLWAAVAPRDARPVPVPAMPAPRLRAQRILVLAHHLLDAAQPDVFTRWELCTTPGVGDWTGGDPAPSALRITCRDQSVIYLRATAASGGGTEPETDPHPDYQIPEGIRSWHRSLSAPRAERVSV